MIAPHEIVAFLQNPWFPEGTAQRHIDHYISDVDFRRRVLSMSMTGKRLNIAFGAWFDRVWWDNANPFPTPVANGVQFPNIDHILGVINTQKPKLILSFGAQARSGLKTIEFRPIVHLVCHHPNARGKTQEDLNIFARDVIHYCETGEVEQLEKNQPLCQSNNHVRTGS